MSVRIRLSRGGAKKRPFYRIVVADSRAPRDGRFIERIGSYNPMLPKDSGERVKIDAERAKYWLEKGARPSDRVHRFLGDAGLMDARPVPARQDKSTRPKPKTVERMREKEDKLKVKAEAESKTAAEEAPAGDPADGEAPAEEAPAEEETATEK